MLITSYGIGAVKKLLTHSRFLDSETDLPEALSNYTVFQETAPFVFFYIS